MREEVNQAQQKKELFLLHINSNYTSTALEEEEEKKR
jgi:hypothetical protein